MRLNSCFTIFVILCVVGLMPEPGHADGQDPAPSEPALDVAPESSKGVASPASEGADSTDWTPLFNGKDLTGWTPKITGQPLGADPFDTVRVEEGMIRFDYSKYGDDFAGRFCHLFHELPLDRYRLRVVYRFRGEQCPGGPGWAWRNSGVMLHCQDPRSMSLDQDFPVSIEAQFLGGDGSSDRTTGNLCTPGTNVVMGGELIQQHCINSNSKTCHGDGWVTAEFEVELESGGATVYTGTLQVGDVAKRGHKWQFLDRKARKGSGTRDGISLMQTTPNRAGVWRVQFKAYADLTTVVDPLIRVSVYVDGTKVYEREEIWRERSNGFLQDLGH